MNIGIIHLHDYDTVNKIAEKSGYIKLDSFTEAVEWIINGRSYKSYKEKTQFLKENNGYVFDIDIGDSINSKYVFDLQNVSFYKVLNQVEERYLCIADKAYNTVVAKKINHEESIIFTPGRCGTHLLQYSLKEKLGFYHHDENLKQIACNYSHIFTMVRKNFCEYTTSVVIGKRNNNPITSADNLKQITKDFEKIKNFTVPLTEVDQNFESFLRFCDLITRIKIEINPNIYKIYFEDLVKMSLTDYILKNPYDKKKLILNYQQVIDYCNTYNERYSRLICSLDKHTIEIPEEFLKKKQ